jgi:hypothetical protein
MSSVEEENWEKHVLLSAEEKWLNGMLRVIKLKPNPEELSSNPNVTIELVESRPDIEWCYCGLSKNPNITWDIVKARPGKPWSYVRLLINPSITWENILEMQSIREVSRFRACQKAFVCRNPNVTFDMVRQFPTWVSLQQLSLNPSITIYDVLDVNFQGHEDEWLKGDWNYAWLSFHPNITLDIILSTPEIRWDFGYASSNPNITIDQVISHPELSWDYDALSKNPNITWDIVKSHPEIPWSYSEMSKNPNITWDIMRSTPKLDWSYLYFSMNPNITWDIVLENPDIEFCHNSLLENPMSKHPFFNQMSLLLK